MTSRVDGYENLEKELDDVVIQAAERKETNLVQDVLYEILLFLSI